MRKLVLYSAFVVMICGQNFAAAQSRDPIEEDRRIRALMDQAQSVASIISTGKAQELGLPPLLPKDEAAALRTYRSVADEGFSAGQYEVGRFYELGKGGLTRDLHEATRYYRLAAEQGNTNAQDALERLKQKQ